MAHFYGTLLGSRKETSRCGTKSSGLLVKAASWQGCVTVYLTYNAEEGVDYARVCLAPWQGRGVYATLYEGPVDRAPFPVLEALTGADKDE